MKNRILIKIIILLAIQSIALAQPGDPQLQQETDLSKLPFLTSVYSLLVHPHKDYDYSDSDQEITLFTKRDDIKPFKKKNKLTYTLHLHKKNFAIDETAPLVFLSPGTGGDANSQTILYLSQQIAAQGYSVVTLPSTTHKSFAIAASTSGRTGYLPDDAKDLYAVLTEIRKQISERYSINPSFYGLVGYSYGGLDVAFLARQDLLQQKENLENSNLAYKKIPFQFKFVTMINPPLNRKLAIRKVDVYNNYVTQLSQSDQIKLARSTELVKANFYKIIKEDRTIQNLEDLKSAFPLKEDEFAFLMGNDFRNSLVDSAIVGDILSNTTTDKTIAIPGAISEYIKTKVLQNLPEFINLGLTEPQQVESYIKQKEVQCELPWAIQESLSLSEKSNTLPLYFMFHTENDPLSFPEALSTLDNLKSVLSGSYIYKTGGHLGELSSPEFLKDFGSHLEGQNKPKSVSIN
jgi:predicted alpha/beta-fold hydrolase